MATLFIQLKLTKKELLIFNTIQSINTKFSLPQKVERALGGDGLSEQGLPRSRGSVEQDTRTTQTLGEQLRVKEGELYRVKDLSLCILQPSNIIPVHIWDL